MGSTTTMVALAYFAVGVLVARKKWRAIQSDGDLDFDSWMMPGFHAGAAHAVMTLTWPIVLPRCAWLKSHKSREDFASEAALSLDDTPARARATDAARGASLEAGGRDVGQASAPLPAPARVPIVSIKERPYTGLAFSYRNEDDHIALSTLLPEALREPYLRRMNDGVHAPGEFAQTADYRYATSTHEFRDEPGVTYFCLEIRSRRDLSKLELLALERSLLTSVISQLLETQEVRHTALLDEDAADSRLALELAQARREGRHWSGWVVRPSRLA